MAWIAILLMALPLSACDAFASSDTEPPVKAEPAPIATPAPTTPSPASPTAAPTVTIAPTITTILPTITQPPTAVTRSPPTATTRPPTLTPQPTATTFATVTVYVGNTDGDGVYLRKTRDLNDRLQAYLDNTVLLVLGPGIEEGGLIWVFVRAPDGTEGYVPSQYIVAAPQATVTPAPTSPPPTATPTPAPTLVAGLTITKLPDLRLVGGGFRRNNFSVSAQTSPGAPCEIASIYRGERSPPSALVPRLADGNGVISWELMLGEERPGTRTIEVTCGEETFTAEVTVPEQQE
ncbi:MAG: hypothetical protein CL878_06075 [Dehalococcoidia bacterium]|nr:hypothetical protein [Dehalococcoidia bacterium]